MYIGSKSCGNEKLRKLLTANELGASGVKGKEHMVLTCRSSPMNYSKPWVDIHKEIIWGKAAGTYRCEGLWKNNRLV